MNLPSATTNPNAHPVNFFPTSPAPGLGVRRERLKDWLRLKLGRKPHAGLIDDYGNVLFPRVKSRSLSPRKRAVQRELNKKEGHWRRASGSSLPVGFIPEKTSTPPTDRPTSPAASSQTSWSSAGPVPQRTLSPMPSARHLFRPRAGQGYLLAPDFKESYKDNSQWETYVGEQQRFSVEKPGAREHRAAGVRVRSPDPLAARKERERKAMMGMRRGDA
ncbi:MAG: hypothetical protein M1817_002556 [Caeruleum heppii]|nr:MAG: hypothetical protein M1817_002556 [Caeruleum heppii]